MGFLHKINNYNNSLGKAQFYAHASANFHIKRLTSHLLWHNVNKNVKHVSKIRISSLSDDFNCY